mmetsp:Transcript_74063/g.203936  ORF Transcript_74063/g.203936 Transcript_74063/m.203936 type:complete len:221 (-) Transcript_74063:430-1092(-)
MSQRSMSNVCALALVVTATPPASRGGLYLARAHLDRSLGSSTSWPPRSMRQHGCAALHPHAAADKRLQEQLPWSLLAVSHPSACPSHPCATPCIAASLLTPNVPLPTKQPHPPSRTRTRCHPPAPHPIWLRARVLCRQCSAPVRLTCPRPAQGVAARWNRSRLHHYPQPHPPSRTRTRCHPPVPHPTRLRARVICYSGSAPVGLTCPSPARHVAARWTCP